MTDRFTLVTGCSSGIGEAVANRLLAEGHQVLGVSRSRGRSSVDFDSKFQFESVDLSDLRMLEVSLPKLAKAYPDVDSIVFCAGIGRFGNLEEFSYVQIAQIIEVNLTAQLFLAKAFLSLFKSRRRGNLVFIGSESALSGGRRGVAYTASKSGIQGIARALRSECSASGVHIGVVTLGMTKSKFYDAAKFTHGDLPENFIRPEDVADAVSLMLHSRAGTVIDEIRMSPLKSVIQRK